VRDRDRENVRETIWNSKLQSHQHFHVNTSSIRKWSWPTGHSIVELIQKTTPMCLYTGEKCC